MGYYLNELPNGTPLKILDKGLDLVEKGGFAYIEKPKTFAEIPSDKGLIAIIDSFVFEAACWIYSEREFTDIGGQHNVTHWILGDLATIKRIAK